eukprot:scaffold17413_cov72-Phaeocystis_antarctica.AAC.11
MMLTRILRDSTTSRAASLTLEARSAAAWWRMESTWARSPTGALSSMPGTTATRKGRNIMSSEPSR